MAEFSTFSVSSMPFLPNLMLLNLSCQSCFFPVSEGVHLKFFNPLETYTLLLSHQKFIILATKIPTHMILPPPNYENWTLYKYVEWITCLIAVKMYNWVGLIWDDNQETNPHWISIQVQKECTGNFKLRQVSKVRLSWILPI